MYPRQKSKFLIVILLGVLHQKISFSKCEQHSKQQPLPPPNLSRTEGRQQRLIEHVQSLGTTWTPGHNFHGDDTGERIGKLLGLEAADYFHERIIHEFSEELPDEFDARMMWPNCTSIGQVRDQGHCGSCYAVSVAAVMTDRLCIRSNGKINVPISAENLMLCWTEPCKPHHSSFYNSYKNSRNKKGCSGGRISKTLEYIRDCGVVTGGDYNSNIGCQPYTVGPCKRLQNRTEICEDNRFRWERCSAECSNPIYKIDYEQDRYYAERAYSLPVNEKQIMKDIMLNGPVQAGMSVYEDFEFYQSGVYYHVVGKHIGDHSVKLIGWGMEKGTKYWLAVNSWNTDWGQEGGLFKILRGANQCLIEESVHAMIPKIP